MACILTHSCYCPSNENTSGVALAQLGHGGHRCPFLQNAQIFDLNVLRGSSIKAKIGFFGINYSSFAELSKIMTPQISELGQPVEHIPAAQFTAPMVHGENVS